MSTQPVLFRIAHALARRVPDLAAILLATTPVLSFAQDDDTTDSFPVLEYMQLEQQSIWVANPRPEPFAHDIGPDSETIPGRLLWLKDRMASETAVAAGLLNRELGEPVSSSPDYKTTQEVLDGLTAEQPLVEDLIEATRQRPVAVPIEGLPGTLVRSSDDPVHALSLLTRRAGNILVGDAIRLWHAGERDAAVDRIAAAFRLAHPPEKTDPDNNAGEPMAAILRVAVLNMVTKVASAMIEAGLTDAQRSTLIMAVEPLDADDPTRLSEPWKPHALGWVRFARAGMHEGEPTAELRFALKQSVIKARAMHAIGKAFDEETNRESGRVEPVGDPDTATGEQLEAAVTQTESLIEAIDANWDRPDFADWWATVEPELAAEPTGLPFVATQWLPILHRSWADNEAWHELRAALIE